VSRNFTVIDCEQRSSEWFAAKAGILSASNAGEMLAKIKTGEAAARRDLRTRLVVERITGQYSADDTFVSAAMQRGTDMEAEARAAYEATTGTLVQEVGFVRHNDLPIGCSPDGVIGDWDGGLEIKCPKMATHLGYLRAGKLPSEYVAQITHTLYVTGAPWWDFCSYDPRFPEPLRLFVVRVEAQTLDLAGYEATLRAFLAEVDAELADVTAMLQRAA
jgi:hypothetical protein